MGVALIRAVVGEAGDACDAGRCAEAIETLERMVRQFPGNHRLYLTLGICHSGVCRAHGMTHPPMAVQYLRHALTLVGEQPSPDRAEVLEALCNALARQPEEAALREAIERGREAAALYRQAGQVEDWARIQFNLGNSWCELSELTGEEHWREAVACYETVLDIRTRQKDPERHAAVLENLGSAYRRLDVVRAIQCYRRALRIFNATDYPARNAALENNLGNAFLSLPQTDRKSALRNATRALRHFDRALRGCDSDVTRKNRELARCRLARWRSTPPA
jgi:tetratricopeptide (TPR) repeat protein